MSLEDGRSPSDVNTLRSNTFHCLHCVLLFTYFAVFEILALKVHKDYEEFDPWTSYGTFLTLALYVIRYLTLLALPFCLLQVCGLVLYNAFPPKVKLRASPIGAPFICFRTVTRGGFPNLVRNNVLQNLELCKEVGLKNFHFEVVTDKSVNLTPNEMVRETVVPKDYRTKFGTLYKGRALQYCLEDDVNKLAADNWIVHLDEETLLTDDSVRGILNFVIDGKHAFGQGLNTYASGNIVNWLNTFADSSRVGNDMGLIRGQFKLFHKPLFGWKGSYMVSQVGAERSVSFDSGAEGSISEDSFFSLKAYEAGYSFDFIDGHMMEKSPFTITDLIQQRKRWTQGSFLVARSKRIPLRTKFWFSTVMYALPFSAASAILSAFFPTPYPLVVDLICAFMAASLTYLQVYGAIRSFSLCSYGKWQCLLCVFGSLCVLPFSLVVDNIALVWALFGRKHAFYIVNKDLAPTTKIV